MTPPLAPQLQQLLAKLPAADRLEFESLARLMYSVRFTGMTTIHWRGGKPHQIDLGSPIRLTIVESIPAPVDNDPAVLAP